MRLRVVGAVLVAGACGGGGDAAEHEVVTVFAAASLTDAFAALADGFESERPGAEVVVNTAASSELAAQIIEGAPGDVFASADTANMDEVVAAGAADGAPVVFATNRLAIMVAPGNPLGIDSVADLADADLIVVTCAPEVPCGAYAAELFSNAGADVTPDSYETNVRAVVTKVTLGEADAGIVYATDVIAAGDDASSVPIPDDVNVVAAYPIVALADADDPGAATAFVEYVVADGAAVLDEFGFASP